MFNIEAEQALLGALLIRNELLEKLPPELGPDDFYEGAHGRIFRLIKVMVERGKLASPISLRHYLEHDPAIKDLGGPSYLGRIAGAAITTGAADLSGVVLELSRRRAVLARLEAATAELRDQGPEPGDLASSALVDAIDEDLRGIISSSTTRGPRMMHFVEAAASAIDRMNEVYQGNRPPAIPTGLPSLDAEVGGLFPGDLMVIGGRPGMGKSALAVSMVRRITQANTPALLVEREMSHEDLIYRTTAELAAEAGTKVYYSDMRMAERLEENQFRAVVEAVNANKEIPLWIYEATNPRLEFIMGDVRRQIRRWRSAGYSAPVIMVDYMQKIAADGRKHESVSEISGALKDLARSEDCAVVALAQLSRQVEQRDDKRPVLSDLRESGSIEEDADVVMFLFREEYYLRASEPAVTEYEKHAEWSKRLAIAAGKIDFIVAKNRAGRTRTIRMGIDIAANHFIDDGPEWNRGETMI